MGSLTNPGRNGGRLYRADKGETRNPHGRPPKLVNALVKQLKEAGYAPVGPSTVTHLFETMLALPEEELERLRDDQEQALSVRIVARSLLSSKGMTVLESMMDRAHGRPSQRVDLTGRTDAPVPVVNVIVRPPSNGAGD